MAGTAEHDGGRRGNIWRIAGWSAAGGLLLLPLVLRAPWTGFDFAVAGVVLGGSGLVLELMLRASGDLAYRAGAAVAVAAGLLLLWANGAVGVLGDENNPANLMFLGVLAIAVLGAVFFGFHAAGMARAMLAAAVAQAAVCVVALAPGLGSPGEDGLYEAALGAGGFGALWLIAAGLFRKAAEKRVAV